MALPNLIWDVTKTDALVWLGMRTKLLDHAVLSGRLSALDAFGISYDLLSVADFTVFSGHAPQIRPPMDPAAGAGANLVNWKHNNDMHILQEKSRDELRQLILELVPERLLAPMRINRSIRSRSTEFIFTSLDGQLGTLTKDDLDDLMRQIREPFSATTTPAAFLANWQASLGDLEQAGQPLSQLMATDILQKCFGPEFGECWRMFVRKYPLVVNRTSPLRGTNYHC